MAAPSNTKRTTEQFILEARAVQPTPYDYSKSIYKNANAKLTIGCPVHGDFEQLPTSHLRGMGCRKCSRIGIGEKLRTGEAEFKAAAARKHSGKYSYDKVQYKNTGTKVIITCPKHGDFMQAPHPHLAGSGCRLCRSDLISCIRTIPADAALERMNATHPGKYAYNMQGYKNFASKVEITCPEHGPFWQVARFHAEGQGCPACGTEASAVATRSNKAQFILKAVEKHGDGAWGYDNVEYVNSATKVEITCHKHGPYLQKPNDHMDGHGCPPCGIRLSLAEARLYEAVKVVFPDALSREKSEKVAGRGDKALLETDIWIPSAKAAIEVNGLRWHSSYAEERKGLKWVKEHHLRKLQGCENNGVSLLTFYEDEVNDKFEIVLNMVKSKLLKAANPVYARNTTVVDLDWKDASVFLEANHIQGAGRSAKAKGLCSKEGNLLAVMVLGIARSIRGKASPGVYELLRYASSEKVGAGCSKLLKAFVKEAPDLKEVVSYADMRFSRGGMYKAMGFSLAHVTPPDYSYVVKNKRVYKSNFRKQVLPKLLAGFDPALTQDQNCQQHSIWRIYNCGLQKWVWKPGQALGVITPQEQIVFDKVRAELRPEMVPERYRGASESPYSGHCHHATLAMYALLGGKGKGYKVKKAVDELQVAHYWLESPTGTIIDPTSEQYTDLGRTLPYLNQATNGVSHRVSSSAKTIISNIQYGTATDPTTSTPPPAPQSRPA